MDDAVWSSGGAEGIIPVEIISGVTENEMGVCGRIGLVFFLFRRFSLLVKLLV